MVKGSQPSASSHLAAFCPHPSPPISGPLSLTWDSQAPPLGSFQSNRREGQRIIPVNPQIRECLTQLPAGLGPGDHAQGSCRAPAFTTLSPCPCNTLLSPPRATVGPPTDLTGFLLLPGWGSWRKVQPLSVSSQGAACLQARLSHSDLGSSTLSRTPCPSIPFLWCK